MEKGQLMTFSEQLQAARSAAGLSQSQAALAMGRSVRTLQAWERAANTPHAQIQALALAALKSAKRKSRKAENVSDQTPRTQDVADTTDSPERLSASVLFVLGLSWWFSC